LYIVTYPHPAQDVMSNS